MCLWALRDDRIPGLEHQQKRAMIFGWSCPFNVLNGTSTDGRCTKKKHALWKMIQRRFVSVVSADEFIWEQEKKNRITFKWKFQTNLRLTLLYSSEINLCTKYYKKESQYLRYITAWKILYIIFESKIRRTKLVLLNSYVCNSPSRNLMSVYHCCGLSFISERFKE